MAAVVQSFVAASGQIWPPPTGPLQATLTLDVVGNELGCPIERRFLEEEPASVSETGKAAHPILKPGRSGDANAAKRVRDHGG